MMHHDVASQSQKNAQILVNLSVMGWDSSIWPNPNYFVLERFLDCEINIKGRHFELIPFGVGKGCVPDCPWLIG